LGQVGKDMNWIQYTIMESVKIDYLVENTFREKPVLQKKRITYLFFFIGCCAFRTIQAYFLNISLLPRAVYVSSTNSQSGKHKA
jgi:hypothetical protein